MQSVTVNLPDPLYRRLRERADQAQRSVEAETVEVLACALPTGDTLSADLAAAIDGLDVLDDQALWTAARGPIADAHSKRLESLHEQRQQAALTDDEIRELASLVKQYERHMLVRAKAAALLRQRGHDVSGLLGQ